VQLRSVRGDATGGGAVGSAGPREPVRLRGVAVGDVGVPEGRSQHPQRLPDIRHRQHVRAAQSVRDVLPVHGPQRSRDTAE